MNYNKSHTNTRIFLRMFGSHRETVVVYTLLIFYSWDTKLSYIIEKKLIDNLYLLLITRSTDKFDAKKKATGGFWRFMGDILISRFGYNRYPSYTWRWNKNYVTDSVEVNPPTTVEMLQDVNMLLFLKADK